MKDYLGTKLEEVYTNAGADGKIMEESQYLAVRRAIINASEIADVISLYEDAVEKRMSADDYNLLVAKNEGHEAMEDYVPSVALNKGVTLDEVLQAELEKIYADAEKDIDDVTVKDYKANTKVIDEIVEEAQKAIDDINTLANTKANDLKADVEDNFQSKVKEELENLNTTFKEDADTLAKLTTEFNELVDAAKVAMNEAVTMEDYDEAKDLAEAKIDAYTTLINVYTRSDTALKNYASGNDIKNDDLYTAKDKQTLLAKAIEEIGIVSEKTKTEEIKELVTDKGVDNTSKGDAVKAIEDVRKLKGSAITSRDKINDYVKPLDVTVPTEKDSTTEKYITAVQSVVNAELAKIDDYATMEAITTNRVAAKKAIYEATRTYMLQLLDRYVTLEANKSTDKLLSAAKYNALQDEKTTAVLTKVLTEADANSTYNKEEIDLVTEFNKIVTNTDFVAKSNIKMWKNFTDNDEEYKLIKAVEVGSVKLDCTTLAETKAVLDRLQNSLNVANSYTVYETKIAEAKTALLPALRNDLVKLVDTNFKSNVTPTKLDSIKRPISQAKTIEAAIEAYKEACEKGGTQALVANAESITATGDKPDNLCGKKLEELGNKDISVDSNGKVTGTLGYVKDYTGFSSTESEGNYLVLVLKNPYAKMCDVELSEQKTIANSKEDCAKGITLIIRLTEETKKKPLVVTWSYEDGEPVVVTYDLSGLTLTPQAK